MKNAGLAGAIALCGIGLVMIGLGNFVSTPRAMAAVPVGVPGDGEPAIVWFDQTSAVAQYNNGERIVQLWRLWSDGRLEFRIIQTVAPNQMHDEGSIIMDETGWIELPAPPGGEGFACRSDLNGDRRVDGADLATLLSQWGDKVSCDPQPTYPCFDLGNLNLPVVAMN
tara:strand:- start:1336 stop:1839 length:504 start_codon:yes stop_codon:yes gene_type:complete